MDLVHLETFLKVTERGSFTSAAESLYVSQATVSARIKALETQLGVALFDRDSHHVTPTFAGTQLIAYATEILAMADDARSAVRSRDIKPLVRLGLSPASASHLAPVLLNRFRELYPAFSVLLEVDSVPELMDRVGAGTLDLALVEPCGGRDNVSLIPLAPDAVVIVAGMNTPFARLPSPVPPDVIAALPFVMRCKQCCTLRFVSACIGGALDRPNFELNVIMWVDELETLKKFVMEGVGVTAISRVAMLSELMSGGFETIEIEGVDLVRQRALAMSAGESTHPAVEALRGFLTSDETRELLAAPDCLLTCAVPACETDCQGNIVCERAWSEGCTLAVNAACSVCTDRSDAQG